METKLYIKGELTSLDILAFFSCLLVGVGFLYIKFANATTVEIIAVLVCAVIALILTPLTIQQKIRPFYILDDEGIFQRGRFSNYDPGVRIRGGRFFPWGEIVSMTTEYRAEYEHIPWLMIILETGENIYFPTMGFQDEYGDEDSFVHSKQFIRIFENHYQTFKNQT